MKEKKPPLIDETTALPLWEQFFSKKDKQTRDQLFAHYFPLAEIIASKYFRNNASPSVNHQDYVHYASIGLLQAIDHFNPSRAVKFSTYAGHRIRGAILDGISHFTEINEQQAFRQRYREERLKSLKPAKRDKNTDERFQSMVNLSVGLAIGLLLEDTGMYYQEGKDVYPSPYESHAQSAVAEILKSLVTELPEKQRRIIEYHYFAKMDFVEIANLMELTRSRISQLHKEAIQKLRQSYRAHTEVDILV